MKNYICELYVNDEDLINPEVIVTAGENGCFIMPGSKEELLNEETNYTYTPLINGVIISLLIIILVGVYRK